MKNLINNLTGSITKAGEIADDSFESAEERQKTLTERHRIDMQSDNKLAKLIRPLTLLTLLLLQIVIVCLSAFGKHVDNSIVMQHGVLLAGAFGFYFNSRKAEKIASKNAEANIKIEEMKNKHSIKMDRKQARLERRLARRAERDQDKKD